MLTSRKPIVTPRFCISSQNNSRYRRNSSNMTMTSNPRQRTCPDGPSVRSSHGKLIPVLPAVQHVASRYTPWIATPQSRPFPPPPKLHTSCIIYNERRELLRIRKDSRLDHVRPMKASTDVCLQPLTDPRFHHRAQTILCHRQSPEKNSF